jgi:ribonuclease P protein component
MTEGLAACQRIRKKKDFLVLYKKGRRYKSRHFSLIYSLNALPYSRVGVVASRKVGGATVRNRAKRWMRELFRRNRDLLESPVDLLIVAMPDMAGATWAEVKEQYLQGLREIGKRTRQR